MDLENFTQRLRASLPDGLVLENPGGGTSAILWSDNDQVCFQRRKSRFYVRVRDFYDAYLHFLGQNVTTSLLKEYAPAVFDSARKGHNCHSTFFFMALQRMGLITEIWGRGQSGSPFGVTLADRPV
jgi:hypothetical protein